VSGDASGMASALRELTRMTSKPLAWPGTLSNSDASGAAARSSSIIGLSKERRAIHCIFRGYGTAPLKVLILAGQHGDESPAQRSLGSLLAVDAGELARQLPRLQVAVIPEANPDGCAVRCRYNAEGIDLNRDHQLLRGGETEVIHQLVRRWRPQVILDLHSYPSRRRHLLQRGMVLDHDVFFDVPNHPAILARPGSLNPAELLRQLLRAVADQRVRAARYTIVTSSGRARHSTPDVVEALNGLALRYGAFTVLVENRQPRRDETTAERSRLQAAQARALLVLLEWLDRHHELFLPLRTLGPPPPGTLVPVGFKYTDEGKGLSIVCRDIVRGRRVSIRFSRYSGSVSSRCSVALPAGYAVPDELTALRAVLRRHGFVPAQYGGCGLCSVQKLRIERACPSRRPGRSARHLVLSSHPMRVELDRYELFSTRQRGGEALTVFLEPQSKHGLHRFAELEIPLRAPSWYPVLRVLGSERETEPQPVEAEHRRSLRAANLCAPS